MGDLGDLGVLMRRVIITIDVVGAQYTGLKIMSA